MAAYKGLEAEMLEAPEDKPLPALLLPALRKIVLRLDRGKRVSARVRRALNAAAGFAKAFKSKVGDIEFGVDLATEAGHADSGDLEADLPELLVAVAEAAKDRATAVVLLIDELQYISETELSALIMGIHAVDQRGLPLTLIAAGLPQLVGAAGRSKSYAERLFDFPVVGPLDEADARTAIVEPIISEGEKIEKDAVDRIIADTKGYPFFLQTWGFYAWNEAAMSPITGNDIETARAEILRNLDASFFRVRFDRLTPAEKRYLRAMAELGPGPHRSGDIADVRAVKVSSVAPTRNNLIRKGMIFAPGHGDTAFTVPLFDDFLKRQLPQLPS
jgi:hypothetical protein